MSCQEFRAFSDSKREEILQEGIQLLRKQKKPNITSVKRLLDAKYNTQICLGTLRNRASGAHQSNRSAHTAQQLLSPVQENILIEWIVLLSDTGHCIGKRTVRKKAEYLCGRTPGQTWVRVFLSRHPEVVLGKPSGLDPKRAQAFNRPTVMRHFDLLEAIIRKNDIPPENIYNMDEKGIQRGGGRRAQGRKFFIPRTKRPTYKLRSGNLELITTVECVAADGGSISPGIIFEGKEQYEREWFEADPKISYVSCLSVEYKLSDLHYSIGLSDNGWTSDFHCFQWFKHNFIPQTEARNISSKPILLIYDGHGSHERYKILRLAKEHNIILFSLPPHTTHKLQPLDVGVFGPFARAWIEACDNYMEEHLQEIPRAQFVKHYMDVRQQSFKATTIRAAFRKTGIWPINRDVFSDKDYAPSIDTSTTSRDVPDSYPVRIDDEWPEHQSWSDDEPVPDSDDNEDTNNNDPSRTPSHQPTRFTASTHAFESASPSTSQPFSSFSLATIPPSRFYSKAPKPAHRGRDTEAYIRALEGEAAVLRHENEELATHAVLAFDQVRNLKRRLNGKASNSKRRKLNTDSRWLNSADALAQCEREEAEAEAEAARKQAKANEKQAQEKERQQQRERRDPNEPFVGSLNSRKKADLQDIAYALGLEIEGRVEDLKSSINAYFDENEEQRTSPRFIGLFPQLAWQARQVALPAYASLAAPVATSASLPLLHNVTNAMISSNFPHSHFIENPQFAFNVHTHTHHHTNAEPSMRSG